MTIDGGSCRPGLRVGDRGTAIEDRGITVGGHKCITKYFLNIHRAYKITTPPI